MTRWRYLVRTLLHHWRINATVAVSVAAATAVLAGALLVGDSVRASLRRLTLDRLGRVDEVLVTDRFFRAELAKELSASGQFSEFYAAAVPAILFPAGTVEKQTGDSTARAAGVQVLGCDESFWSLGDAAVRPDDLPNSGEIVLNQVLADQIGAVVGDQVVLRLPKSNQVPADSPLANKSDRGASLAGLRVVDIIPATSLGQFQLRPSQMQPRNAYVSLGTIQQALDLEGRINAILVSGKQPNLVADPAQGEAASRALAQALRPSLADYGLTLKPVRRTFPAQDPAARIIYDYYSLTTDRMIFAAETERAVMRAVGPLRAAPVFTYVVNSIQKVEAGDAVGPVRIPYSMVTAIDISDAFPLEDLAGRRIGPLAEGQIVLTRWAAEDLDARVGDRLRIEYFAPETTHGQARERSAELAVRAVTPLTEPVTPFRRSRAAVYETPPVLANDPDLTPEVKGVTDQETIDDWDAPFPIDYSRVRAEDDDYWANHRTTPKGFVSLATGQRLWRNRFGRVTSFRIPARAGVTAEMIAQRMVHELNRDAAASGFAFTPVKRQQLRASQGTTPFDALFLALSFFIIAAALMLVALLFRLGVERRAEELGTLLAVGLRRRQAAGLLILEAICVAAGGGALGLLIGIGYAQLMLYGLRTWWLGAITAPFVHYHATLPSLILGYSLGVLVCLLTIGWSIAALRRVPVRRLLAGRITEGAVVRGAGRGAPVLSGVLLAAAALLLVTAARLAGMMQAGAFVAGGAALLAGVLVALWSRLKRGGTHGDATADLGLLGLAWRNAARNPTRSVITMGLIATASFLIVATSSFRLAPTDTGVGGFQLVAEASQPVFGDLNSPSVRDELLADRAAALRDCTVFGLRLRAGDDASCNNLYQPSQPRVLGITPAFIAHFDNKPVTKFAWSSTAAGGDAEQSNPWRLLARQAEAGDEAIPTVIDMNTALYSLKPPALVGSVYEASYESGSPLRFRIVGLLENSMLQGALLISEAAFERCFPDVSGYRYFLVKTPPAKVEQVRQVLEDRLGDQGFDAVEADQVLAQLLAVQNAYLSTFQSLGALGLLFGTFGLATVQARNVVERRGELALLRATGFRQRQLAKLVLYENVALLATGLVAGVGAALLAVVPHKSLGAAAIPWSLLRDLGLMLAVVFLVGLVASFASVRTALRAPLLEALRRD